jgi:hypothetical protein
MMLMMSKVNKMNELFGEVISCYSRKQALEDGVLVDLNQFIPISESGYKYPVACTIAVWGIIESAVNNPRYGNDYAGIVWDILHMSRNCPTKKWPTGCLFQVVIIGAGSEKIFTFKIEFGPGDRGELVLTIMMPDED